MVGVVHLLWIGFLSVCGCVCALHYCFCYRLFVVVSVAAIRAQVSGDFTTYAGGDSIGFE